MMNIIRRGNLSGEFGQFDDWFRELFPVTGIREQRNGMRTDIREENQDYVLVMDIPGFRKEDIKISIENGYLTVEAIQMKTEDEQKQADQGVYLRRERYYGQCSRSFYVGDVKENRIQASHNDGTLTIRIPKAAEAEEEVKKYISIE